MESTEHKREQKSRLSQPILDILPDVEDVPIVVEQFDEVRLVTLYSFLFLILT